MTGSLRFAQSKERTVPTEYRPLSLCWCQRTEPPIFFEAPTKAPVLSSVALKILPALLVNKIVAWPWSIDAQVVWIRNAPHIVIGRIYDLLSAYIIKVRFVMLRICE